MNLLIGIHPVREALKAGRHLERVLVARGAGGARIQEIVELCRRSGVPLRFESREVLERMTGKAVHQGVVAVGAAQAYRSLEEVAPAARLLVLLDGVEDPHNLGAIIRTANGAGAGGVCIPERRSAGLTEAAAKAAAGALEYTPVVRIGNVSQTLERLKKSGFWIYGLDERGTATYDQVEFLEPAVLVFGSEGRGLHQHVRERCDFLVRIPLAGQIPSLNVSVAAGVILFEWKRRRQLDAQPAAGK